MTSLALVGDIDAALTYARSQVGHDYDHTEGPGRFGPIVFKCSGLVSQALWKGGMRGACRFG